MIGAANVGVGFAVVAAVACYVVMRFGWYIYTLDILFNFYFLEDGNTVRVKKTVAHRSERRNRLFFTIHSII